MTLDDGRKTLPNRREFISLGIGAFVVGTIPFAAHRRKSLVRRTIPVMGTLGEVAVVHKDERYAQGAIDAAFTELRRVEALLTRFDSGSEVGRANLLASSKPTAVSSETAEVLRSALQWAEVSQGAFDPCLARAVALWDVGNRTQPPDAGAVRRFAHRGLYRALELGRRGEHEVVVFHQDDMGIDLGGIGKGWGVDRAVESLRSWGIQDAVVNVGGDLYAMGTSEDGDSWKVGVRSPDDPAAMAATLRMTDRAVATSGDYQQYFEYAGRRYHHLLDPETGAPSDTRARSVTVAAESCMAADAGATTAFVTSVEAVRGIFPRVAPGAEVLHTL